MPIDFKPTSRTDLSKLKIMGDLVSVAAASDDAIAEAGSAYALPPVVLEDPEVARMVLGARNSQILSHITELAQSLRRHPRDVVLPFFQRIAQPEYRAGFDDAVQGFVDRIMKRAVEKRKEMDAERRAGGGDDDEQELSREERLGPGGLDPVEVFETLPRATQEAFDNYGHRYRLMRAVLAARHLVSAHDGRLGEPRPPRPRPPLRPHWPQHRNQTRQPRR